MLEAPAVHLVVTRYKQLGTNMGRQAESESERDKNSALRVASKYLSQGAPIRDVIRVRARNFHNQS